MPQETKLWEASSPPPEKWDNDLDSEWVVKGIVNEEVSAFGDKWYEVKWDEWHRADGTNTTWEIGSGDIAAIAGRWDRKQANKREVLASESTSMTVRQDPQQLLHEYTTAEQSQAFQEKMREASRVTQARFDNWDEVIHLTEDVSDDDMQQSRQQLRLRNSSTRSQRTTTVSSTHTPTRSDRTSPLGSVKTRRSTNSPALPQDDDLPSVKPTPRSTKPLPKRDVQTASSSAPSSSTEKPMTESPANSSRRIISERWTKAALRAGAAPVTIVNTQTNSEDIPPLLEGFQYLERSYIRGPEIPETEDAALVTCECGECHAAALCGCQDPSDLCDDYGEKEFAYNDKGLFLFNLKETEAFEVIECNKGCKCNERTCLNRVAQRPRDVAIEVFRTANCGWGARATVDLPKGKVVGIYTGELIRREEAVQRPEQKSYIFDLDCREGAEVSDDIDKFSVDSHDCGNWTRFINHSCHPNMQVYPVVWDTIPEANRPYLAFVTVDIVKAYTELTIDYDPQGAAKAQKGKGKGRALQPPPGARDCKCGADNCRGWVRV